jgi:hypothetical protein
MEITYLHLQHLSPLGWEHIMLTGDYIWNARLTTSLRNLHDLHSNHYWDVRAYFRLRPIVVRFLPSIGGLHSYEYEGLWIGS